MIRFGPAGNSDIFYQEGNKNSLDAPKWLATRGLYAYEYSFGRGFTMGKDTAEKLGENAKRYGVQISVHAPYYINLANPSQEMIDKSFAYITNSLRYVQWLNGNHVVVHIGSCGKMPREEALMLIKNRLIQLKTILDEQQIKEKYICIETMGKHNQIGTYEEIIDLCSLDERFMPCFDFGHINAYTGGGLKTIKDYEKIFDYCKQKLGEYRTSNCHIHFSKIEYSVNGGEVRHLDFTDTVYGPDFEPLAKVIKKNNYTPVIICESKNFMAEDALKMKNIFENI